MDRRVALMTILAQITSTCLIVASLLLTAVRDDGDTGLVFITGRFILLLSNYAAVSHLRRNLVYQRAVGFGLLLSMLCDISLLQPFGRSVTYPLLFLSMLTGVCITIGLWSPSTLITRKPGTAVHVQVGGSLLQGARLPKGIWAALPVPVKLLRALPAFALVVTPPSVSWLILSGIQHRTLWGGPEGVAEGPGLALALAAIVVHAIMIWRAMARVGYRSPVSNPLSYLITHGLRCSFLRDRAALFPASDSHRNATPAATPTLGGQGEWAHTAGFYPCASILEEAWEHEDDDDSRKGKRASTAPMSARMASLKRVSTLRATAVQEGTALEERGAQWQGVAGALFLTLGHAVAAVDTAWLSPDPSSLDLRNTSELPFALSFSSIPTALLYMGCTALATACLARSTPTVPLPVRSDEGEVPSLSEVPALPSTISLLTALHSARASPVGALDDPALSPLPYEGTSLRILMVLPGENGEGADACELATLWHWLTRRGHQVVLSTRTGTLPVGHGYAAGPPPGPGGNRRSLRAAQRAPVVHPHSLTGIPVLPFSDSPSLSLGDRPATRDAILATVSAMASTAQSIYTKVQGSGGPRQAGSSPVRIVAWDDLMAHVDGSSRLCGDEGGCGRGCPCACPWHAGRANSSDTLRPATLLYPRALGTLFAPPPHLVALYADMARMQAYKRPLAWDTPPTSPALTGLGLGLQAGMDSGAGAGKGLMTALGQDGPEQVVREDTFDGLILIGHALGWLPDGDDTSPTRRASGSFSTGVGSLGGEDEEEPYRSNARPAGDDAEGGKERDLEKLRRIAAVGGLANAVHPRLQAIVRSFWFSGRPLCATGGGVATLAACRGQDGRPLLSGSEGKPGASVACRPAAAEWSYAWLCALLSWDASFLRALMDGSMSNPLLGSDAVGGRQGVGVGLSRTGKGAAGSYYTVYDRVVAALGGSARVHTGPGSSWFDVAAWTAWWHTGRWASGVGRHPQARPEADPAMYVLAPTKALLTARGPEDAATVARVYTAMLEDFARTPYM